MSGQASATAVHPQSGGDRFRGLPLSRIELALMLLMFGLLAGANGFRFSFNSALPCGILAIVLIAIRLSRSDELPRMSAYAWTISAALALWFVGAFTSALVHLSNDTLLSLYAGYLVPLLIYSCIIGRRISQVDKQWIVVSVALGAMIPWISGIVAYLGAFGFPDQMEIFWNRYDQNRMGSYRRVAFGNTSHMALYIAVVLPPLLAMAASRITTLFPRIILVTSSMLGLLNMLMIFSRGAMLTLFLMLLFWIWLFRSMRLFALVATLVICAALALGNQDDIYSLLFERTLGALEGGEVTDGSIAERVDSIAVGWKLFAENPVFGVGPGQTYRINEWSIAHQLIIEEASSIGICGLVATTALSVVVLIRSGGIALRGLGTSTADVAIWSGVLGWILYTLVAGGLLHQGLLIPWAGLFYGFLALTVPAPRSRWAAASAKVKAANV
jgi:O-antigen ligase